MSYELYMLLTGSDFPDDEVYIHWALSFFKSGCAATFAKHIVRQEIKNSQMMFSDWNTFTLEFVSAFCPENEAIMAFMQLESDRCF
jgi:oligoribonuclease (3'-5' exoribonuclease)